LARGPGAKSLIAHLALGRGEWLPRVSPGQLMAMAGSFPELETLALGGLNCVGTTPLAPHVPAAPRFARLREAELRNITGVSSLWVHHQGIAAPVLADGTTVHEALVRNLVEAAPGLQRLRLQYKEEYLSKRQIKEGARRKLPPRWCTCHRRVWGVRKRNRVRWHGAV
jgi:hypothetical protein